MRKITFSSALITLFLYLSSPSFAADQIMVDREEYEQLKAAVEMMLQKLKMYIQKYNYRLLNNNFKNQ